MWTCISLLAFLVSFYLLSLIQTDMVVSQPPPVITSYADLLSSDRRAVWFASLPDKTEFEFAPRDSLPRRIWDREVRRGIRDSLIIGNDIPAIIAHATEAAQLQSVFLIRRLIGHSIRRIMCKAFHARGLYTDSTPIYRHDESARERLQVSLKRASLDPAIIRYFDHRTQLSFEAGIKAKALSLTDFAVLLSFTPEEARSHASLIEMCSCDCIRRTEHMWQPVHLSHYASLFVTGLLAFSPAVLAFTIEWLSARRVARMQAV